MNLSLEVENAAVGGKGVINLNVPRSYHLRLLLPKDFAVYFAASGGNVTKKFSCEKGGREKKKHLLSLSTTNNRKHIGFLKTHISD